MMFLGRLDDVVRDLGKVVWSTLASMEDGKMGHGQKNVELNIS
jgi:hypothetical protein